VLPPSHHHFDSIWGHEPVKRLVRRMIESGRLPHALMLHGPDGVGKRSLAFAIAKMIFSAGLPTPPVRLDAAGPARFALRRPPLERDSDDLFGGQDDLFGADTPAPEPQVPAPPPEPDPALKPKGTPRTRAKASAEPDSAPPARPVRLDERIDRLVARSYPIEYDGDSPVFRGFVDLNIIEPPEKKKSILVEQIRDLQDLGWMRPMETNKRVILIFGADTITLGAANSLLKLLEEPPSYLVLILVTNQYNRVLETIRSRCASLPCHALPRDDLKRHLVQDEGIDPSLAQVAATLSGGRPAMALDVAHGALKETRREVYEARLDLERVGMAAMPATAGRALQKAGSIGQASLLLMTLARDRMVRSLVPESGHLLVNEDMVELLDEVPADVASLWEEAERLTGCLRLEDHPLVIAPEAALEVALWRD
jgi:DNA polymerase III delta prime subunit